MQSVIWVSKQRNFSFVFTVFSVFFIIARNS